jgi:hypothetical protein
MNNVYQLQRPYPAPRFILQTESRLTAALTRNTDLLVCADAELHSAVFLSERGVTNPPATQATGLCSGKPLIRGCVETVGSSGQTGQYSLTRNTDVLVCAASGVALRCFLPRTLGQTR